MPPAWLKHFLLDALEVDRAFIREIPKDTEDRAVTETIIVVRKSPSLTIVAESVDTVKPQTLLRAHARDEIQGVLP